MMGRLLISSRLLRSDSAKFLVGYGTKMIRDGSKEPVPVISPRREFSGRFLFYREFSGRPGNNAGDGGAKTTKGKPGGNDQERKEKGVIDQVEGKEKGVIDQVEGKEKGGSEKVVGKEHGGNERGWNQAPHSRFGEEIRMVIVSLLAACIPFLAKLILPGDDESKEIVITLNDQREEISNEEVQKIRTALEGLHFELQKIRKRAGRSIFSRMWSEPADNEGLPENEAPAEADNEVTPENEESALAPANTAKPKKPENEAPAPARKL